MKLKAIYDKIDEIPEAVREMYEKQADGTYILAVDDSPYKAKLGEFRTNNDAAKKELAQLQTQLKQFEGIDPAAYKKLVELQKQIEQDEDSQLIKEGKLDEVVKKRSAAMQSDYERRLKASEKAQKDAEEKFASTYAQLKNLKIRTHVIDVVSKMATPVPGALTDIINRAQGVFDLDEKGEITTKNFYNKKSELGSMEEWAQDLIENSNYLFERAQGSGTSGTRTGGGVVKTASGQRVIPNDPVAIGQNMADIASGKAVVQGFDAASAKTV